MTTVDGPWSDFVSLRRFKKGRGKGPPRLQPLPTIRPTVTFLRLIPLLRQNFWYSRVSRVIFHCSTKMSFDDLSDLETQTGDFPAPSMASPAFTQLTKSISHGIYTLTSNVALIHRYIGFLDTSHDTDKMRSALMDTLEKSKSLSKGLIAEIRELSGWDPEEIGATESYEQRKLLGDFQKAVTDFQFAQRLALEKQRGFVKNRRKMIEEEQAEYEPSPDGRGERIRRAKEQQTAEEENAVVALNEELIAEREHEIQGIEQGIIQMNELFRDLGVIVAAQGTLLGVIPSVFCECANRAR